MLFDSSSGPVFNLQASKIDTDLYGKGIYEYENLSTFARHERLFLFDDQVKSRI